MLALRRSVERALSVLHYHASNWELQGTSQNFTCSEMPVQLAACFQTVKARECLATGFHLHQSCGEAVGRASREPRAALPLCFPFPTACSGCTALGYPGATQQERGWLLCLLLPAGMTSGAPGMMSGAPGGLCVHPPTCLPLRAVRGVCAGSHRNTGISGRERT